MTDSNHKPTSIYRRLYKLNRYLDRSERALNALMVAGVLGHEIVTVWLNGLGRIRSEINCEIIRTLSDQMNEALEKSAEPFRQRNKKAKNAK